MMREISVIPDGSGHALLESQCDLVYVLMGKSAKGCTFEQMVIVWSISARYITRMYNRVLASYNSYVWTDNIKKLDAYI